MSIDVGRLLADLERSRKECRQLNTQILCLEARKSGKTDEYDRLCDANDQIAAKVDAMNEILEGNQSFDIDAMTEEIESLEAALKDCRREEDQLLVDIDRLENALAVQHESKAKLELAVRIRGSDASRSPKSPRPDECFIALRRGIERDLESLERSDACARTVARKRCQLHHAEVLA
jgi:chromosome segregation ATPase